MKKPDDTVYNVLCNALALDQGTAADLRIMMDHILNTPLAILDQVATMTGNDPHILAAVALFMAETYRAQDPTGAIGGHHVHN